MLLWCLNLEAQVIAISNLVVNFDNRILDLIFVDHKYVTTYHEK